MLDNFWLASRLQQIFFQAKNGLYHHEKNLVLHIKVKSYLLLGLVLKFCCAYFFRIFFYFCWK